MNYPLCSTHRPMCPAPPRVAIERLKAFKASFADMERKLKLYGDGEDLFGLPKSQYPDLATIRRRVYPPTLSLLPPTLSGKS